MQRNEPIQLHSHVCVMFVLRTTVMEANSLTENRVVPFCSLTALCYDGLRKGQSIFEYECLFIYLGQMNLQPSDVSHRQVHGETTDACVDGPIWGA